MTGFSGCMVAFVDTLSVAAFAGYVQEKFASATDIEPKVYPVQAVAGARVSAPV